MVTARAYPLPRPESGDDPRFCFGLLYDVGKVLEVHGFPSVRNGSDHVDLAQALFAFIFGSTGRPAPDAKEQPAPVEDDSPLTLAEYRYALSHWENKAAEAKASGDQAALAYRTEGVEALRKQIRCLEGGAQ